MPFTAEDADGNKIEAFTKADLEAERQKIEKEFEGKLKDKDLHVNEKLNEFINARKGDLEKQDQFKVATEAQIAEAKKAAEDAKQAAADAESRRLASYKDFLIKQSLGEDPELTKKFEEAYVLVNMPATTDAELSARIQKTIEFAGLNAAKGAHIPVFGGSYAPKVGATEQAEKDADFEKFKNVLNLGDLTPPKQ